MHPVAIIFGFACAGTLIFSYREKGVAYGMAWVMAAVWAVANQLWLVDGMVWLALFDMGVAMLAYAQLLANPSGRRFIVATMFGFRMTLHVANCWGMMPRELYLHWINAAFLVALIAISWKGAQGAITNTIDRVRRVFHICSLMASRMVKAP